MAVGLAAGKVATGGLTYVNRVFPKTDATFTINEFSPARRPTVLDEVRILPNLGEDKVFHP